MPENQIESKPEPKSSKRKYNRKPVPVPPPAPNPTVLALESKILELVEQRMAANQRIAQATAQVGQANSALQLAQMELQNIEREVSYRLNLIAQMKGESRTVISGPAGTEWLPPLPQTTAFGRVPEGVGSIPPPQPRIVSSAPRIRSESAEDVRALETSTRAML